MLNFDGVICFRITHMLYRSYFISGHSIDNSMVLYDLSLCFNVLSAHYNITVYVKLNSKPISDI